MKKLIWITFCTMIGFSLTLASFALAEDSEQMNINQKLEFRKRWQDMTPEQREKRRQRWQNQTGENRSEHRTGRRYNSQGNRTQSKANGQGQRKNR